MSNNSECGVYFFLANIDYYRYIIGDSENNKKYKTCKNGLSPFIETSVIDKLCKFVFHPRLARCFPEFIKKLFYPRIAGISAPVRSIYVVNRCNRLFWEKGFLRYIKHNRPDIIICAWMADLLSLHPVNYQLDLFRAYYDYTITYDPNEAMKYGFHYFETPYTRDWNLVDKKDFKYDLVFVGKSKISLNEERYSTIISVFRYLKKRGLKLKFYITDVPKKYQLTDCDIIYNQPLPYEEVLKLNLQSKCILDVPQLNETGTTLRMFEAITYDRRLLFCNPNLKNHDYYDEKNMKYFDKAENIDIDFICSEVPVHYDNKQLLSVEYFIDSIKNMVSNSKHDH